MSEVIPISEAKASLSRLVKRASQGEVIYLGAYGHPQAVLAPVPSRRSLAVGVWREHSVPDFEYDTLEIIAPDDEFAAEVAQSVGRVIP